MTHPNHNVANTSTIVDFFQLLQSEEGKQQYTLKVQDNETKQTNICSYRGNPICTTYHDALTNYAAQLVRIYGRSRTYTIAMITDAMDMNLKVGQLLELHYEN